MRQNLFHFFYSINVSIITYCIEMFFIKISTTWQSPPPKKNRCGFFSFFFASREIRDTLYTRGPNFPHEVWWPREASQIGQTFILQLINVIKSFKTQHGRIPIDLAIGHRFIAPPPPKKKKENLKCRCSGGGGGTPVTSHETIYCPLARDHAQVTIHPGKKQ